MNVLNFGRGKKIREVTISLTPLIDVLFLFIIFFMLTGTFKRVGELELQLPDSSTAAAGATEQDVPQLELIATEDGRLLLDGAGIEMPQLKQLLVAALGEDAASHILIKAEAGVDHGEVVRLLDIVRDAGFAGVGIGTYTRGGGEPTGDR
ncbi:MAG: biopolymer transporter ExbD [bacterium]|nr:biopolymer transporter ExbD [bacterium]